MKLNNKGESLVEALCALLIIIVVITGFSSVILSVTKTNNMLKETRVTFNKDTAEEDTTNQYSVSITLDGNAYSIDNGAKLKKYIYSGLYSYDYDK